ncbi:MAG: hypothetical protein RL385_2870, partial [Pseudomonadota bacterium]
KLSDDWVNDGTARGPYLLPAMQTPITYFPPATQRQLELNRERIRAKPYAHYFDPHLSISTEVLPALQAPMDPKDALPLTPAGVSALLEPGYHRVENGYCGMPDGTAYTASLVDFPGCTPEMFAWYFWWHNVEAERYTLWYPHNHVRSVPRISPAEFEKRWAENRLVGLQLDVDEYIGPYFQQIMIEIVAPEALGFDTARFAAAGVADAGCARVWLRKPQVALAKMVHLFRHTDRGFEVRSRYWMAHDPALLVGARELPLGAFSWLGRKQRGDLARRMAYEQLLHDQIEFTHLASFLARAYAEFGRG